MTKNSFFEEFVDPFQKGSFVIRAEHYMRYVFAARYLSKNRLKGGPVVYDIGCGNGYGMKILADNKTGATLIGFDRSTELISSANKKYSYITCIRTDFERDNLRKVVKKNAVPTPNAIIAFETLEHIDSPIKLLREAYSLLPKGGSVVISVPNERYEPKKNGKSKNKFHKHLFSQEQIINLIGSAGFTVDSIYGQPLANTFYHKSKYIVRSVDALTNLFPVTFPPFARLIATPKKSASTESYSFILIAMKH